jgi:PAS domain S-box-containing protein
MTPMSEAHYSRQLEAVCNNAMVALFIMDEHNHCTYMNPAAVELTGFTFAEMQGRLLHDLIHHSHPDGSRFPMEECPIGRALLTGSQARGEEVFVHKDGHFYEVAFAASPIREGESIVGAVLEVQDITERRRVEEELRESATRLQFTLESAQVGDWDLDLTTDAARRSLRHDQCFGYTSPIADWGFEKFIQHVHPEDRAGVEEEFRAAASGEKDWHFECRVVWPDASVHWIAAHGSIYYVDNKPNRMLGIVFDITERKRVEEELRRANARLIESDRRKDEFLAMLAHELRNPLAAVRNTVRLLERTAAAEPRSQRYLGILERQTRSLGGLVDDLLDVSRITRGLVELKQARVDLGAAVDRALESVQVLLDEKRHEVSVTLPRKPACVAGDPLRLEQILVNLLTNAAKYTDPGGRIAISLECRGDSAELRVRDSGIGLEPDVIDRIFDLFGQAQRGLDRAQGGLGIGLTIVKNLVELHGGQVEATSEGLGKGAEFIVTLPLAPVEDGAPAPAAETRAGAVRAKRVLVVDDNTDIAGTLALLLEESGHTVAVAHDGPSALAKAEEVEPELILLDIGLPGMDGYEVAKQLRQNPRTRSILLAALTGYGQAGDRARAQAAGFDKHFVKPVDIDALEAFVNEAQANPRQ